jgi:hypothetical protein
MPKFALLSVVDFHRDTNFDESRASKGCPIQECPMQIEYSCVLEVTVDRSEQRDFRPHSPRGGSVSMDGLRLSRHVVHEQVLSKSVRRCEVCLPTAHFGYLSNKLN